MDHKGLATLGPFTPELDAVFVNVSLVPRPPQEIGQGLLPDPADKPSGRRVLGDFLGGEKPALIAVVGSPGSGKTTLLRHAARGACLRKRSRAQRRGPVRDIPVLLYAEICQVMLWRRQDAKKLPQQVTGDKEAVLGGLAYAMMQLTSGTTRDWWASWRRR
jgi:hypothetical protein